MFKSVIAFLLIAALMISAASAEIINVPGDYDSIQQGIDAGSFGDTVLVQPGTYYENINFNGHNVVLGSLFLTTGDSIYIATTIIDGDSSGTVVTFGNNETNAAMLVGFTIQHGLAIYGGGIFCGNADPIVRNNVIAANEAFETQSGEGGGVYCIFSNMILLDNVITANYASGALGGFGAGIYCENSAPLIFGNIIARNLAGWGGGGIYSHLSTPLMGGNVVIANTGIFWGGGFYLDESSPFLINNSIYGNEARWQDGGGIYCVNNSNPFIMNCIFWADSALEEGDEIYVEDGTPVLTYTDIGGGWPGIGNMDIDPDFRNPESGDYHLKAISCGDQSDSPCIDVGSPLISDSLLDCAWGLGLTLSDLGAYGGGDSAAIAVFESDYPVPDKSTLLQNYPNPFNARTTIGYELRAPAYVTLQIFDLLGRKIETLIDENKSPGEYSVVWNADNVATGIYLYKIRIGDFSKTRRMLLIK